MRVTTVTSVNQKDNRHKVGKTCALDFAHYERVFGLSASENSLASVFSFFLETISDPK